jgi:hypothetical protein
MLHGNAQVHAAQMHVCVVCVNTHIHVYTYICVAICRCTRRKCRSEPRKCKGKQQRCKQAPSGVLVRLSSSSLAPSTSTPPIFVKLQRQAGSTSCFSRRWWIPQGCESSKRFLSGGWGAQIYRCNPQACIVTRKRVSGVCLVCVSLCVCVFYVCWRARASSIRAQAATLSFAELTNTAAQAITNAAALAIGKSTSAPRVLHLDAQSIISRKIPALCHRSWWRRGRCSWQYRGCGQWRGAGSQRPASRAHCRCCQQ